MAPSGPSSAGMSHGQPWEDTRSAKTINKRGRRRKSLRLWSLSRSGLRPNCRPVIFLLPRSGSRTLWDYRATGSSGISPGALQSQLAKWISLSSSSSCAGRGSVSSLPLLLLLLRRQRMSRRRAESQLNRGTRNSVAEQKPPPLNGPVHLPCPAREMTRRNVGEWRTPDRR